MGRAASGTGSTSFMGVLFLPLLHLQDDFRRALVDSLVDDVARGLVLGVAHQSVRDSAVRKSLLQQTDVARSRSVWDEPGFSGCPIAPKVRSSLT